MQIERPDWFTPPETVYWDELTGYAINLPFVLQGPPFWWKTDPQAATRIQRLRVEMGITVDDFPDGEPEFTSSRPPPRPPQERGRTKRRPPRQRRRTINFGRKPEGEHIPRQPFAFSDQ